MNKTTRRALLAAVPALAIRRAIAGPAKVLRVGTQKGAGILMAERQQRGLETLLNPLGIEVQWTEFQFGPPILEAMRAGGVDIGLVGDTPPIFAQAAHSDLLYVAAVPSGGLGDSVAGGIATGNVAGPERQTSGFRARVQRAQPDDRGDRKSWSETRRHPGDQPRRPPTPAPRSRRAPSTHGRSGTRFTRCTKRVPAFACWRNSTDIAPQNSFIIASRALCRSESDVTAKRARRTVAHQRLGARASRRRREARYRRNLDGL